MRAVSGDEIDGSGGEETGAGIVGSGGEGTRMGIVGSGGEATWVGIVCSGGEGTGIGMVGVSLDRPLSRPPGRQTVNKCKKFHSGGILR